MTSSPLSLRARMAEIQQSSTRKQSKRRELGYRLSADAMRAKRQINATSNILSYVAIGIGITGLALQGLRLGFEATRIGKLGEVVSSLFLGRLLSA